MAAPAHSITTPKISPVSRRAALFGVAATGLSPALALPERPEESPFESAYAEFRRLEAVLDAAWEAEIAALDAPGEYGLAEAEAARRKAEADALKQAKIIVGMEPKTLREFAIQAAAVVFIGEGFEGFVERLAGCTLRHENDTVASIHNV